MIPLAKHESTIGVISILRTKRTGSLIYKQGDHFQSESDSEGISLASYIHALFGLIRQARCRSVLIIGCGGGTLATMLVKAACDVTIVDIDPMAFIFGRQYFRLPATVRCEVADGCDFLRGDTSFYDAIVLDAYAGDRIPRHLQSLSFFRLAKRRLSSLGQLLANVHVPHDLDRAPDDMATCLASIWPNVCILDTQGRVYRNAIVMAGDVLEPEVPSLIMPPSISAAEIAQELGQMRFRSERVSP